MKTRLIAFGFSFAALVFLTSGCERGGKMLEVDDESDRPGWAGGNTSENPHINRNDDSGTTRGGDYGDLYVLLRDDNGVPVMRQIGSEWYTQPVDANGLALELDAEGELVDETQAIPVDFGRLNVVRSPQEVLDQAFAEALKTLTAPNAVITLDFCGRLTSTYDEIVDGTVTKVSKTIDSPRENMAIYQYLMRYRFAPTPNGPNQLAFLNRYGFDPLMIAASCVAAGSDKTGTLNIDEIVYINGFLDATGTNPILNEHEYDFNHDYKYYYNYGDCDGDGSEFKYNRENTYRNRYIQFLVWDNTYYPIDENGNSEGPVFSVLDYMEGFVDGQSRFTFRWGDKPDTRVSGFTIAADDAVQVLETIHGNTNIRFLPDYQ